MRRSARKTAARRERVNGGGRTAPRQTRTSPDVSTPGSSRAELAARIKTARQIMRRDAGLNSDVDRIPQLAWLLFLKAFDDAEGRREVTERNYQPAISAPYRWRDWAADSLQGQTGPQLLRFVNDELLPYLRSLRGTGPSDPRDVLAGVFKETFNRMLSGYLLRDVVNLVDRINFGASDDIHTMALLYESMLREMRDAAGDAGEFYTPRPVIRFIVKHVGLHLGDTVLDPAVGTGGFLVEALEFLRPDVRTVSQWQAAQHHLRGIEKKPMPFLLGVMNLLLHGVDRPNVRRDNALGHPLAQISASAKVDVVVTNPPFGGEEEKEIPANFPLATRTAETALLFLQFIQRSLKPGGRCGMVVPHSVLFGGGVAARVKEQLLRECDVHTIVRLPAGVFEPYTDVPTNLLFFEKTGPTSAIWFYENPLPIGRKTYTKSRPLQYEELSDCERWWGGPTRAGRIESDRAWRVPIADIVARGFDLDLHSSRRASDASTRRPDDMLAELDTNAAAMGLLVEDIRRRITELA